MRETTIKHVDISFYQHFTRLPVTIRIIPHHPKQPRPVAPWSPSAESQGCPCRLWGQITADKPFRWTIWPQRCTWLCFSLPNGRLGHMLDSNSTYPTNKRPTVAYGSWNNSSGSILPSPLWVGSIWSQLWSSLINLYYPDGGRTLAFIYSHASDISILPWIWLL